VLSLHASRCPSRTSHNPFLPGFTPFPTSNSRTPLDPSQPIFCLTLLRVKPKISSSSVLSVVPSFPLPPNSTPGDFSAYIFSAYYNFPSQISSRFLKFPSLGDGLILCLSRTQSLIESFEFRYFSSRLFTPLSWQREFPFPGGLSYPSLNSLTGAFSKKTFKEW